MLNNQTSLFPLSLSTEGDLLLSHRNEWQSPLVQGAFLTLGLRGVSPLPILLRDPGALRADLQSSAGPLCPKQQHF